MIDAEWLASLFHEAYERLAPDFSYTTRKESAVPWKDVPETNKRLMIAVAAEVLQHQGEGEGEGEGDQRDASLPFLTSRHGVIWLCQCEGRLFCEPYPTVDTLSTGLHCANCDAAYRIRWQPRLQVILSEPFGSSPPSQKEAL